MERIVNGHYADPDSTRDVIGITPDEFETLIESLQFYYKSLEMLLSSTKQQKEVMMQAGIDMELLEADTSGNKLEKAIERQEERLLQHYNNSYEILAAINQPYPGATY